MNNSIERLRGIAMLCGFVAMSIGLMAGTSRGSEHHVSWEVCDNSGLDEDDLKERISNLSSIVDMKLTPDVLSHINRYLRYKEGVSLLIGRQMAYFPIFEDVLIQKQLPTDLKYLTVIESALRPSATSKVGAAGLWQLMRPTGRMLGLKINRVVDERKNPYLSTEAATDYLSMLYKEFGDWTLVLAAYNSGPGRVRSAIRKSGSKDYWTLRKFLPKETRNYIPAYIAATYLSTYYYLHDITPTVAHADFMSVTDVQIYDEITFKEIEEITGTSVETIKTMNPCYLRSYVPKSEDGSHLLLPNYAGTLLLHHFYKPDSEVEYILPSNMDNTTVSLNLEMQLRERMVEPQYLPMLPQLPVIGRMKKIEISIPEINGIRSDQASWYKLGKRESLRDVAIKHEIPLSKLISLNANGSTGRLYGRLIRLN